MARKQTEETTEDTTVAEENDAEDPRSWEHPDTAKVRDGELSAAQIEGGHGNVDPDEPDAQYPPGVVDNSAAVLNPTDDPQSFVPPKNRTQGRPQTTSATPRWSSPTDTD